MKPDNLMDAIGAIDNEMTAAADQYRKKRPFKLIISLASAAACALLVFGSIFLFSHRTQPDITPSDGNILFESPLAITQAVYPVRAQYPDINDYIDPETGYLDDARYQKALEPWSSDYHRRLSDSPPQNTNLNHFYSTVLPPLLTSSNNENRVCSPLNLYLALSMLSEVTEGESRRQILDVLGESSLHTLRQTVSNVWHANYIFDGHTTSLLSNSIWLNDNIKYDQTTLEKLASHYYTSSFAGEPGSDEMDTALRDWINTHTGDLLTEEAAGLSLDPDTVMALISCIYFQASWEDAFSPKVTSEAVFHTPNGDITCDFMHQANIKTFFDGENFSAVSHALAYTGNMWLILPDEGVAFEQIIRNPELLTMFTTDNTAKGVSSQKLLVNLSVPKFDVSSDIDLIDTLLSLGITDVLDYTVSDFSPLTQDIEEIYLSQARHAARVSIDEEGCTAAAYTTLIAEAGGALVADEIDFVLNRPFLFAITGSDNSLLFIGTVNTPLE